MEPTESHVVWSASKHPELCGALKGLIKGGKAKQALHVMEKIHLSGGGRSTGKPLDLNL